MIVYLKKHAADKTSGKTCLKAIRDTFLSPNIRYVTRKTTGFSDGGNEYIFAVG